MRPRHVISYLIPLAIVMLLGALYTHTLLPHIGYVVDTTKFQYVGYMLSTPHETGYPLYLMLTYLFTHLLPFGTVAWRTNLFSAVCTLCALLLFHALLRRLHIERRTAFVTTLIFGTTATLWLHSLVAEVYTLNLLFVLGTLYCLIMWLPSPDSSKRVGKDGWFYAFALIYAISFGNHMSMILLLPTITFLVFTHNWRVVLQPRKIAWVLFCIILGASTYLLIYGRSIDPTTPYVEARITDWTSFVDTVTGRRFQGFMFAQSWEQLRTERIPFFILLFRRELSWFWPFCFIGVTGVTGVTTFRNWRVWGGFIVLFLTYTVYNLNYAIPDIEPYLIPGFFVCAVFVAAGIDCVIRWIKRPTLILTLTLLLVGWQTVRNYPIVNQNDNIWGAPPIEDVFRTIEDDTVLILPNLFEAQMVWYFLYAENYQARNIYGVYDDGGRFHPSDIVAYLNGTADIPTQLTKRPPRNLTVYCYSAFSNCNRYVGADKLQSKELYPHLFHLTVMDDVP